MKKRLLAALAIICLLLCSGCYSRRELNTQAIVNSCIYDIDDQGKLHLNVEIKKAVSLVGTQGGGSKSETMHILTESDTTAEIWRGATERLDRKLYMPFIRARFYTEAIAKKDTEATFDFIVRDHELRESAYIAIIKGENPDRLYDSYTGLADSVGDYFYELSTAQQATSSSVFVRTIDFIDDFYSEGKQPVMGVVTIAEKSDKEVLAPKKETEKTPDKGKYKIVCEGLAAFKDKKMVGYFDSLETRAYNAITNDFGSSFISVEADKNISAVEVIKCKTDKKVKLENGQISILVEPKFTVVLCEQEGDVRAESAENLKKVEEAFNKLLDKQIKDAIIKAQREFGSDIFGFGNTFHKQHPKEWEPIKQNWDEYFSKAKVEVKTDSTVNFVGKITTPISTKRGYNDQ